MTSVASGRADDKRRHRRLTTALKESLREMNIQLSLLNHHVGAHLALRDIDFTCFDLLNREGPLSPTAVARRAGVHPATMTGILDRLEAGGWIIRERDVVDRRAVVIRALRDRNAELFQLLSGMNSSMDEICAGYTLTELELIAEFLEQTAKAGRHATNELVTD